MFGIFIAIVIIYLTFCRNSPIDLILHNINIESNNVMGSWAEVMVSVRILSSNVNIVI